MRRIHLLLLGGCTLFALAFAQQSKPAQQETQVEGPYLIKSLRGPDLYRAYCASCHGLDGRGGGPVVPALRRLVPDLTQLSSRNNGKYPADQVRAYILGNKETPAHGNRAMPVWGPVFFQVEEDSDYGPVRTDNVVKYVESMQQTETGKKK